jgi:hypothetical protein
MRDAELIKKLGRRIHNQRVALRENWMIIEMRAHECAAEIYRGRRRLNIKWWDLVKSRGTKIQSLTTQLQASEKREKELVEMLTMLFQESYPEILGTPREAQIEKLLALTGSKPIQRTKNNDQ